MKRKMTTQTPAEKLPVSKKIDEATKKERQKFIEELNQIGDEGKRQYEEFKKELKQDVEDGLLSEDKIPPLLRDFSIFLRKGNLREKKPLKPKKRKEPKEEKKEAQKSHHHYEPIQPPFQFDNNKNVLYVTGFLQTIMSNLPEIACQIVERKHCLMQTNPSNVKILSTDNGIFGIDISKVIYTTGNGSLINVDLCEINEILLKIDFELL